MLPMIDPVAFWEEVGLQGGKLALAEVEIERLRARIAQLEAVAEQASAACDAWYDSLGHHRTHPDRLRLDCSLGDLSIALAALPVPPLVTIETTP